MSNICVYNLKNDVESKPSDFSNSKWVMKYL